MAVTEQLTEEERKTARNASRNEVFKIGRTLKQRRKDADAAVRKNRTAIVLGNRNLWREFNGMKPASKPQLKVVEGDSNESRNDGASPAVGAIL